MDEHETYLGDGVYASFDGYQIWLAANDHNNKVVALEPMVLASLFAYAAKLGMRIGRAEGPKREDQ